MELCFPLGRTFPLVRFHSRISAAVINDSNPMMAASHLEESVYCAWAGFSTRGRIESIDWTQAGRQWCLENFFSKVSSLADLVSVESPLQVKGMLGEASALHAKGWMYGRM